MKATALNLLLITLMLLTACGFKNTSPTQTIAATINQEQNDSEGTRGFNKNGKTNKVALIVTISEYAPGTEWASLNADNDADLIKYGLTQQGFQENNIYLLQNQKATKTGILEAIETQLIEKAKKGGVAVFHFSGHGQQVRDNDGDEVDGFDEAIVPYDSAMKYTKGKYTGDKLILDEELGSLLQQLRLKLGPKGNVLVILDSCHSGTGTRGLMTARGTEYKMADDEYIERMESKPMDDNNLNLTTSEEEKKLAPMVAFFGASANELNYETRTSAGKPAGSLSYAFSQALGEVSKNTSYQELFEKVKVKMSAFAPNQHPQAEGQLDQEIMGGKMLGKLNYFQLKSKDWVDNKEVGLSSGLLSNLFSGTKLAFYPTGTRDIERTSPVAKGEVKEAELLSCTIELEFPARREDLEQCRIFITEHRYDDLNIKIKIDLDDDELKTDLKEEFSDYPMIKIVEANPDLIVYKTQGTDQVQLVTLDEQTLYTSKKRASSARIAIKLCTSILGYVQCTFLRTLEVEEERLDLRLDIIAGESGRRVTGNSARFRVGDQFKLRIKNYGSMGAYFTVLDIQPDNKVGILIPNACSPRTSKELFIKPGDTYVFDCDYEIQPPYGTDVLKLIATRDPLDLSGIVSSRGETPDSNHPFEKLFAASYAQGDRGLSSYSLFPEINIYTTTFSIVE